MHWNAMDGFLLMLIIEGVYKNTVSGLLPMNCATYTWDPRKKLYAPLDDRTCMTK